jgi:hypothetical protein
VFSDTCIGFVFRCGFQRGNLNEIEVIKQTDPHYTGHQMNPTF